MGAGRSRSRRQRKQPCCIQLRSRRHRAGSPGSLRHRRYRYSGCDLLRAARLVPTGICVGAADLYDTRHEAAKEAWAGDIPTSRDYRGYLDNKDVDVVLIATPDHLHRRVRLTP